MEVGDPNCNNTCPTTCFDCYGFRNESDDDDMKCTSCKDPYINAEQFCKHQCDSETECKNNGKCVKDNDGVSETVVRSPHHVSKHTLIVLRLRNASVPKTLGRQDVKVVWNHTFIQNTDAETNVTSQIGTKLLIGNINAVMVENVLIQAINQPMKLGNIAYAPFNTEVSTGKLYCYSKIVSIYYRIFM